MLSTTISIIKDKSFSLLVDDVNDKVIARSIMEHKVWEPLETNLVTHLLSVGQTVVDVGANIGYYTLLFSKIVGDKGKVLSFEPEKRNYTILNQNVLDNKATNVALENKALSDREGSSFLYLSNANKGDHRLSFVPDRDRCMVDFISLDEYLNSYEGNIHFLKSDTQGHELEVLNGMKGVIQKNISHFCCLIEFSPGLLESSEENKLEGFLDFFEAYRAEIYWLKEGDRKTELTLVDKKTLRKIATAMLEHFESDYSRDILIFFSSEARCKFFHEMGLA